jgi:hypothetical protein
MQKTVTKLLILTIAFTFALSVNYLFAAWSGPTQTPPGGNTPAPVHVGLITQTKDGGLIVGALRSLLDVYVDGKVGIGTTNPSEALEVAGGVKVGNTTNANAGTIRWTGADLEVYDGSSWKSLTATGGGNVGVCASSGSQEFTTIGESFLNVDDSMINCFFLITVKGAGGYNYAYAQGGKGGGTSFIYIPRLTGVFGVYVGEGGKGSNHGKQTLGGGGTGSSYLGGYVGSGGGASAVKFNSTILNISGGGGSNGYWGNYYHGGNGGSGNNPGKRADAGGYGGSNGVGGSNLGGKAGKNGGNLGSALGGIGVPAYNIGGGGAGSGAGGGGGGGYGGGGGGGLYDSESGVPGGGGGGGGFLDFNKIESFAEILGADSEKDGSVLIEWSKLKSDFNSQ